MPRLFLFASLLLALALPAAAQSSVGLSATSARTLFDTTDRIKGDDGAYVVRRTTLTYDPVEGVYVTTIADGTGAVVERHVRDMYVMGPTAEEEAAAQALIQSNEELAGLMSRAVYPVTISGGFPLVREEGHGCGPGSRCLQYDIYEIIPGQRAGRRVRYVVVDLRELTVFDTDFDVLNEGNLANPAARTQSRSR